MKHEIGDIMGMGYALEGNGWLAAAEQRFTRAAWLLGAAAGRWQLTGGRLGRNATAEALHARAEQLVRDALGEERYRALHEQGAAYPLEEIVRLAAEDADALPPHPADAQPALAPPPRSGQASASPPQPALTSRELEIAGLVSEGLSNRQIAERLVISKRTVDAHIEHIYGKLGVSSRVALASWLRSSPP
jgi:non-specific serine/threonine protein kinase